MDLAKYQEQSENRDRITSSKMVTNWVRSDEDLVNNVQEVGSLFMLILMMMMMMNMMIMRIRVKANPIVQPQPPC